MELPYTAKGYWEEFSNLKRELLTFIKEHGTPGMMPTQPELKKAGRSDLHRAIWKHGGSPGVAGKIGLELAFKRKQTGYWEDFSNLKRELLAFIQEHGTSGVMPTHEELTEARRSDLVNGIRKHGGQQSVAEQLGLTYAKKRQHYWKDFSNLKRELLAFIEEHGTPGVMLTHEELQKVERSDLSTAIRKHGGISVVAEKLGLELTYTTKQHGYWDDFSNIERELLAFIDKYGTLGVMPTSKELREAGRHDLANAIAKHGGYLTVTELLGLALTHTRKPFGYWHDFSNFVRELLTFIEEYGTLGIMPTHEELKKADRGDLSTAIQKHGGQQSVAEKLGLTYAKKRDGYWDEFSTVEHELMTFIEKQGSPGVMPTSEEFIKVGRSDLQAAIQKHGGQRAVAERLGLRLAYTAKPSGYWDDFSNLEAQISAFIEEHGNPGIMPTRERLKEAERGDLVPAIHKQGGFSVVARRLGLIYSGKEYITPGTASDVEKTARAIQPLAESNLLSGAQVMVILRRAGLLEYRNKRVVRLGASLARGNHDEIETAISQLASTSEEITTETDNIEESENLTAEESEALVNSGLESTENPPLDKSTPGPDTQREQAVIRGLTALGELRLPLDEVLSLLTSKLLWQAFYKRLYTWYGGLDAAQNITAEDVEAAILSTYPEHTENEFVAEASARFILEVEQAVNFAASLPNYDWHGFRLRLHQADAARRMAEVLTNQDSDQYCPNRVNLTPQPPH